MPTYEYLCQTCSHRFETWQKMTDEPLTTCPECGSQIRRVFYPAGLVFKGSGFYKTDHGNGALPASNNHDASEKTETTTKSDSKTTEASTRSSEAKSSETKSGETSSAGVKQSEMCKAMAESALAALQRQQIEIAVGELLLTSDHYMRQITIERIRHLIAHADPTLDIARLSEMAQEELQELGLLPPNQRIL